MVSSFRVPLPSQLIVVVSYILLSYAINMEGRGIGVVGDIPRGTVFVSECVRVREWVCE